MCLSFKLCYYKSQNVIKNKVYKVKKKLQEDKINLLLKKDVVNRFSAA